jgi:15-cis-phytoene synthase
MSGVGSGDCRELRERVGRALAEAGERWATIPGFPRAKVEGKLLRPQLATAAALPPGAPLSEVERLPKTFWQGVLAIQMVHEASLIHDDILDQATYRRGVASLQAERGLNAALVQGDHLLTGAYRLAAATDSLAFVRRMAQAVERTVAGEKAQGASRGEWLSEGEYREIVSWKSGELFGCALALGRTLEGDEAGAEEDYRVGVRVGCLYQMVDDFLDLCPSTELGKPALQDLGQEKWTWPLTEAGIQALGDLPSHPAAPGAVRELLFRRNPGGSSPMGRALDRLRSEVDGVVGEWVQGRPGERRLARVLDEWVEMAREAMVREEGELDRTLPPEARLMVGSATHAGGPMGAEGDADLEGVGRGVGRKVGTPLEDRILEEVRSDARALGGEEEWLRYFAHHGRSFRFAARLFPEQEGRLVAGVYAFCRFTDDLVDRAPHLSTEALEGRLDAWMELTRAAYRGEDTGVPLLTGILGETAERGVPLLYAEELIRGVAMDLTPPHYEELADLRRYSYRVASVVGLWLTELFGTRTPWVLRRAEAMGHAMQLTNILRDVGEDFREGRIYLPRASLVRHGIGIEALAEAVGSGGLSSGGLRSGGLPSGSLPSGWAGLMEELMAAADAEYEAAFPAIPALPRFFQGPVAVAARVYQGIHHEIRRNGYDNLHRRAYTSLPAKLRLGSRGLLQLRKARKQPGADLLLSAPGSPGTQGLPGSSPGAPAWP